MDLHLHSYASGTATNWWVKGLGLGLETRESYTPPADAYQMAKAAGMDFVTLTDHETIDGALTLADRPDFLVGVEVAAIFPEDGSAVDILVFGLDTAAHWEIQARRPNVYRLVEYLREAGLVHILAHPVFEMGARLDRAGVEKRLVLFGLWEFVNGSRPAEQSRLTIEVASGIGTIELRQMAHRHGLAIPPHRAIAGTGGSDDHGGIYAGTAWTVVPQVRHVSDLIAALAAGEVRPGGAAGSVEKMAATGFQIVAGAARCGDQDLASLADGPASPMSSPLSRLLSPRAGESQKLLEYLPLLSALDGTQIRALLVARYERQIVQALGGTVESFPVLGLLSSVGSFVDAHLLIAPYLGIHGYFGRERYKTRALRRDLFPDLVEPLKVGLFVDELDEIHGVATMYRNLQRLAAERPDDQLCLVGSGRDDADAICLRPVANVPMPLYDGHSLGVPSLLDVIDHIANEGYNVLHVATPGPLGLAVMVAGITLGLPIVGAFHTEFGLYARTLSGDDLVADIVEVLVREFYERCAVVTVPSQSTVSSLQARGYRIGRFEVLKNGVDTQLYRPDRRDPALHTALGGGRTLLLYVGRVSREKGLSRLADNYLALRRRRDDVHLVVAGDGPYRRELEERLGESATFTGFLRGEELARTFAACDLFVFPSTTDTLGRAVAEAQASGLPAVVFGLGGPQECIRPGTSGFVVEPGDDAGFVRRIEELLDDPDRRQQMGIEARTFADGLIWDGVLDGLIQLYREMVTLPAVPIAETVDRQPERDEATTPAA